MTDSYDLVFVANKDGTFLCGGCARVAKVDLADVAVEVWETWSGGWTAPCVCVRCKRSIEVFVNGEPVQRTGGEEKVRAALALCAAARPAGSIFEPWMRLIEAMAGRMLDEERWGVWDCTDGCFVLAVVDGYAQPWCLNSRRDAERESVSWARKHRDHTYEARRLP